MGFARVSHQAWFSHLRYGIRTVRYLSCTPLSFQSHRYSILDENNILRSTQHVEVDESLNLFQFVTKDFARFGDNIAYINAATDEHISFNQLLCQSNNLSHYLNGCGFKKKDVLGMYSANRPECVTAMLGVLGVGSTLTTANPAYTYSELLHQVRQSEAKLLFTQTEGLDVAQRVGDEVGIHQIIMLDDHESNNSGIESLSNIVRDRPDPGSLELDIDINEDIAFLPFSSGTTGLPKGVMMSHRNVMHNMEYLDVQLGRFGGNNMPHPILLVLPFYHVYGLVIISLFRTWRGKTVVTLPGFEPISYLKSIEKYKVENLNIVPPLMLFMLKHPLVDEYDMSSIKIVTTGAAPCSHNTVEAFLQKFPSVELFTQGYASTEMLVTHLQSDDMALFKPGSVGYILPGTEIKVRCIETGESLGPHQVGEICARGASVMKGYWNNSVATADSLTDDGWYHSGDLGYFDEDHDFYIVDRLKELIKVKGLQVAPAELEDLLTSHEDIIDAAVIGVPDEMAGELPFAYVVKKADSSLDEVQVQDFVASTLSKHKHLKGGVLFIDAIPKAPSGKILRRVLRDEYKKESVK